MRRLTVLGLVMLAGAACGRTFEAPSHNPLSITPQFTQVAPREHLQIVASGGQPPYTFSFLDAVGDTPPSGRGGTLDASGNYQAGPVGPTQDRVQVRDAQGATLVATIGVGSRLQIINAPSEIDRSATAQVTLTGGKQPYRLEVQGCDANGELAPDGGSGGTANIEESTYTSGARPDAWDCLVLTDATQDPLARAVALIHVRPLPPVVVSPANATVAPRQSLTFTATGGAGGPYVFSLVDGGTNSGDATLTAAGDYQAGMNGFTQDAIEVVDQASGQQLRFSVSIGQQLIVSPPQALLAPLGTLQPVVTGGLPPYLLTLNPGCGSGSRTGGVGDGGSGGYIDSNVAFVAGPNGNTMDCIDVTDSTQDPEATATVHVTIGPALSVLVPGNAVTNGTLQTPVPPLASINVLVQGGQPPYDWTTERGFQGTYDPTASVYTAPQNAPPGSIDHLRFFDSNQAIVDLIIPIGPSLAVSLQPGELHPGNPLQATASGGQPPYTYGFAPKGDHSGGTVDATTGVYTPGPNFGAADVLQASDASGAVFTLDLAALGRAVGALEVPYGGVNRFLGADLNGDGMQDLVLVQLASWGSGQRIVTALAQRGAAPVTNVGSFDRANPLYDMLALDVDGDGHDDLVYYSKLEVGVLHAATDGTLDAPWSLLTRKSAVSQSAGFAIATALPDAGRLPRVFAYDDPGGACDVDAGSGSTIPQGGIVELDFAPRSLTPQVTCRVPTYNDVNALAAGDWNGDGEVDLAWVERGALADGGDGFAQLNFQYGTERLRDGGVYTPPGTALQLPNEMPFLLAGAYPSNNTMPVVHLDGGDAVAVLLNPTTGLDEGVVVALPAPPGEAPVLTAEFFPYAGTGHLIEAIGSIAASSAAQPDSLVAWDGLDGVVSTFKLDANDALASVPPPQASLGTQVDGMVSLDFNGDGVLDLAYGAGGIGFTTVLWGEGDGTFARLRRYLSHQGTSGQLSSAVGDVDGDGIPDILVANGSVVTPLYGGGGQLAYGPSFDLGLQQTGISVGDLDGVPPDDLLAVGNSGGLAVVRMLDGGSPMAPIPLLQPDGGIFPLESSHLDFAEFGGAAPGLDLWDVAEVGATWYFRAYVRDQALGDRQIAHSVEVDIPPTGAPICDGAALDLDGDGIADLVSFCFLGRFGDGGVPFEDDQLMVNYAVDAGASLAFGGWADAGMLEYPIGPVGHRYNSHLLANSREVAIFATRTELNPIPYTDASRLVIVSRAGTQQLPLDFLATSYLTGAIAPLGPGGATAFAVRDTYRDVVHLFDLAADGGFVERPTTLAAAGTVSTAIPERPGAPADLVMISGSDFVIHPNDGGQLQ